MKAMELVFHGPLPEYELGRVLDAFRTDKDYISKDEFARTIAALRRADEEDVKHMDTSHTAHYNSFSDFKAARLRQRRPSHGPAELYTKPLTQLQEVGWRTATAVSKGLSNTIMDPADRKPKKQCEETKFMGALLKGGYL
jgi:glucuronate isomerase